MKDNVNSIEDEIPMMPILMVVVHELKKFNTTWDTPPQSNKVQLDPPVIIVKMMTIEYVIALYV